ncbi:MAG: TIGR03618 family F420-dependent PPOX class oxidoreductase [Candidatus Dadabacteria bacterium]|nr:MAG: TIGR03618 family F420-dependent PPOX class oxidoreductase [Candidatus Dadabacteria bacterium]
MSRQEEDELLRSPQIGVLATADARGRPEASPVWYDYDGSRVRILVLDTSRKARNLRENPFASLTVDTRTPPYKGVILRGHVTLSGPDPDLRRKLAERYLGPEKAARYIAATSSLDERDVLITLHVTSRFSWDYSKGL